MQRHNLVGNYLTTTHPKTGVHNFRMTPAETMQEDWTGHTLKAMRSPMMAKVSEMIDPTTSAILLAFAKSR